MPSDPARIVVGQVRSNCQELIDATILIEWHDGPAAGLGPQAFITVRRVQPGESRPFSETVAAGLGAQRATLSVRVSRAAAIRTRR